MGERSKRLIPAGREAVVRLIQAGGVHRETVHRIRKELRKELHPIYLI
jgi:hypothetical protein